MVGFSKWPKVVSMIFDMGLGGLWMYMFFVIFMVSAFVDGVMTTNLLLGLVL